MKKIVFFASTLRSIHKHYKLINVNDIGLYIKKKKRYKYELRGISFLYFKKLKSWRQKTIKRVLLS